MSFQKASLSDGILSSTASHVFPWRFIIHPSILNSSSKGNLLQPSEVPRIISSFSSEAYVLVQIHFRRFFNKTFQHLLQVFLRVGYDPARGEDMPVLQFRKTETGKISRERTSGDHIFLDRGSAKIGDKTFGFLIVLDGATSHLTANPCKSTSVSEVIAKTHEWMDTFQMKLKAICSDMAFHHLTTCRHSTDCTT